ncbi:hypothetical protein BKA64DRAFT_2195 [Cadophora sp. MPI-SDFR-AT-0126]|nr:hypothetical protein BKA64DRAFT_2195 [Leotiomycetes sp. MPI-SDFR-AT-0126]
MNFEFQTTSSVLTVLAGGGIILWTGRYRSTSLHFGLPISTLGLGLLITFTRLTKLSAILSCVRSSYRSPVAFLSFAVRSLSWPLLPRNSPLLSYCCPGSI